MSTSFNVRIASSGELVDLEEVAASLAIARAMSRSLFASEGGLTVRMSEYYQLM